MSHEKAGVPVTIMLPGDTFLLLEKMASHRGTTVRIMLERLVERATTPAIEKVKETRRVQLSKAEHGRRISEDEVQIIVDMTRAKKSAAAIAARIGCHPNTVVNWRIRMRAEGVIHV